MGTTWQHPDPGWSHHPSAMIPTKPGTALSPARPGADAIPAWRWPDRVTNPATIPFTPQHMYNRAYVDFTFLVKITHVIRGLDLEGHVCRATVEFYLLMLSNTAISFVVFQCGVKDMFSFVSLVLSLNVAEKEGGLTGLRMRIGMVKLKLKSAVGGGWRRWSGIQQCSLAAGYRIAVTPNFPIIQQCLIINCGDGVYAGK